MDQIAFRRSLGRYSSRAAVGGISHETNTFSPIATAIVKIEVAGLSSSALGSIPSRRVRRPCAPLDGEVRFLD